MDALFRSVEDPRARLHAGRFNSFHCCFGAISNGGISITDLGIFAFKDCVQIDFRMGKEWNSTNLNAFFRLLADLKALAPEVRIKFAESERLMDEKSFLRALRLFTDEGGRTNG